MDAGPRAGAEHFARDDLGRCLGDDAADSDATGRESEGDRRAEAGAYPRPGWRLKLAEFFDRKPSDIWPVE